MANFFEHQAKARSATKKLVFLYILAVITIVATITIAAHIALTSQLKPNDHYSYDQNNPGSYSVQPDPGVALADVCVAGLVLLVIGIGTAVRMIQVGGSGEKVAQMLGGEPLSTSTQDPLEKRLLNVVEEMAIASGTPVPRVFILRDEPGINAFAAGMKPGEAVIGVTRGTLETLTRDELQGVIAHEFSHIFNGDMRLNLRLMGVLGGILAIATIGRVIVENVRGPRRSNSKDSNTGGIIIAGLVLLVVGYIGVFFARLIKAAVSRQREYLADASAVQFTRNPDGIGGALMKIRDSSDESRVRASYAEETSHMFFGSVSSFSMMFATHPALEDRVTRVAPALLQPGGWKPREAMTAASGSASSGTAAGLSREEKMAALESIAVVAAGSTMMGGAATPAPELKSASSAVANIVSTIGVPSSEDLEATKLLLKSLPDSIREQTRDPVLAVPLVLCLFFETDDGSPTQQAMVERALGNEVLNEALRTRRALASLAETARLTLLELSVSALRNLPLGEKQKIVLLAHELTKADGTLDLYEYVAVTLLEHQLIGSNKGKRPRPTMSSSRTNGDLSILLSSIAYAGADDVVSAKAAFDSGLTYLSRAMNLAPTFRTLDECELESISGSIDRLSYLLPGDQKKVIEACVQTIVFDRHVTTKEAELLRALCTVLEAPLPALAV